MNLVRYFYWNKYSEVDFKVSHRNRNIVLDARDLFLKLNQKDARKVLEAAARAETERNS